MTASIVALAGALCYRFRALQPILEEHLSDNDGEVLAYLLLPDIVRYLSKTLDQDAFVQEVWSWLEAAYEGGDSDERDLVVIGAVEMIPDPGEPGSEMRSMLGPRLRQTDPWLGNPTGKP